MCVPEGMCMAGHTGNPSQGAGRAILSTTMDMIPRNGVIVILSLPLIFKKEGFGESGAEHFLFNDLVQIIDKLLRYKQKTNFGDLYILIFIF